MDFDEMQKLTIDELRDIDKELLVDYIRTLRVKWEEPPNGGDWEDYRELPGSFFAWCIIGKWHVFKILGESINVKDVRIVKSASFEDHLEELWQSKVDGKWFRHAGGGRGFYWTQLLELVEVVE